MAINIEMSMKNSTGTYDSLYPKTLGSLIEGAVSNATNATIATNLSDNISASQVSSGTLDSARIPNLNASKITSGTLSVARGGTGVTSYANLANQLQSYFNNSEYELSIVEYLKIYNNTIEFPRIANKSPKFYYFNGGVYWHIGETMVNSVWKSIANRVTITLPFVTTLIDDTDVYISSTPTRVFNIILENGNLYSGYPQVATAVTKGQVLMDYEYSTVQAFSYSNDGYTLFAYTQNLEMFTQVGSAEL